MAIREATRDFVAAVQSFDHEGVKRTSLALYEIARSVIEMRRAEPLDPADDPTSGLLATRVDGEPLPDDMVLGTIRQFIVVGMVAPACSSAAWSSISPRTPSCRRSSAAIRVSCRPRWRSTSGC